MTTQLQPGQLCFVNDLYALFRITVLSTENFRIDTYHDVMVLERANVPGIVHVLTEKGVGYMNSKCLTVRSEL